MGTMQADKSSNNFTVVVMVLLSTLLLPGAAVDVGSAASGTAMTILSFASMQLTSRFSTISYTNAVTQPSTNVEECYEWTEWMDDEDGGTLEPSSIGEFELINNLRGPYGFCDDPTDIECALAHNTSILYNETGQVDLTCNLEQGFTCFHSQQSGDCLNYAIRVQCPAPCPLLTTRGNAITTQSPECEEDEKTDCSAKIVTCPREFQLNVTISSDTNIGMCLQQNITKAIIEELPETFNRKEIPVCCFSTDFKWIQRSSRRRDTTGSTAIMVSELLVDDSATVDAQTILEAFISSINQSNVFKSYGISYEPGTASVDEPDREPATSKPEEDSVKIVIVVCSTIAGLIVVIAVALCCVCIIRHCGRRGKRKRNPVIYRK